MGSVGVILMIFSLIIAITSVDAKSQMSKQEKTWFRNVCRGKEKIVKIHFYVQDVLSGPNKTVWEVSRSNITSISPTSFGQVRVLDDLITAGPEKNSTELGRLQGLITFADLKESALAMNINVVFSKGKYNGSTLCVLGRNPILEMDRELPIVGGTGVFRMARGYSISNTYSYDPVQDYGVLEYTIYVAYVMKSRDVLH
ncbi:Dirigent protein 21 [Abeliophyllum distichum]|uniref:Dirigent protein n=1 Tax=Abeliophyllum distichum TaxID=126358 RepID=A0ABD1P838_9LAMI